MAKLRNIIHSDDACTLVFKGDIKKPEPSLGAIRFPGGNIEVSRTSDGQYWAHITVRENSSITSSRIDYDHEHALIHGIPNIPDKDHIKHIAIKISGKYEEWEDV